MKKKLFLITVPLMAILFFLSQQSTANNFNGFSAEPGSYEILSSYQGKNNVLKVDRSKTNWFIASYSLAKYRRKPITIEFSADVRREGSAGGIFWQVNNPTYPTVSSIEFCEPNQWHSMRGKLFVTPAQNDPIFFLSNYEMPSNTIIYITNPVVIITEGNPLTPDLSLTPLKEIYENYFLIGNITERYTQGQYFNLLKHHYNIVTSTHTFPNQIAPMNKGGAYRFSEANNAINLLRRNNIPVRSNTLVWHQCTPAWMFEGTREEVIQNMNNYITAVLRNFRGKINSWDVVNEAIRDGQITSAEANGDWRNSVRRSTQEMPNPWFDKLEADYIELAFRFARAADPNVTLYYNDYDYYYYDSQGKTDVICKMIKDINDRYKRETGGTRNLIEGYGMQAHYDINLNLDHIRRSLEKLISLGIEISISELDVRVTNEFIQATGRDSVMTERDAIAQGVFYARLMNLFKEYSAHIKCVIFWDIDDNNSWLSVGNPTLFDWKLNAKPAFHAVSDPDGFLAQHGGRTRR